MSTEPATATADPNAAWDKDHFHVSQIRTYLTCPRQYLFRHVLGIKSDDVSFSALVGSAIHQIISSWHLRQREPAVSVLLEEFANDLKRRRDACWGAGREITGYDGDESFQKALTEGGHMLTGYCNDARNHVAIVANETRFRIKVRGGKTPYQFAGTIDQARRESEGHLHLIDLKTGKTKPQQILLDLDMQLSLYALALLKGELEVHGDLKTEWKLLGERPAQLSIIHLRDYIPYTKNEFAQFTKDPNKVKVKNPETGRMVIRTVENPRYADGYKIGEQRGPVFYSTQRGVFDLQQAEKDLSRVCAAIKFKMFFRRPVSQGACIGFCRFVAECTADRSEPI